MTKLSNRGRITQEKLRLNFTFSPIKEAYKHFVKRRMENDIECNFKHLKTNNQCCI